MPATPSERPARPASVPAGVEYHRVLADKKHRIGRGIFAIVLLLAGAVVFINVISRGAAVIDLQMGNTTPILGGTDYTPLYHASTMLSLAVLIPWSMVIQRWLYGVPGPSLHSVVSRFRFDVFGRALLLFSPVWIVVNLLPFFTPGEQSSWSQTDLIGIFIGTLLLTPLQAAGEEYGVRGLVFRVAGSWARGSRAGLVIGVLVSSVVFTAIHGSTDPYINVWYFVLAAGLALITWRSGGIEIAVVLHAVLNTVVLIGAALLRVDLGTALQDRSAGVGSPYQLVPTLTVVVITAVVWWCTRRTGPALTPARPPLRPDARL
ncbi:lysostaphin resistance A-like protein [Nodosilinea sp. LEGE 07088]|uniref:CPBP family intramembrane glutamic endopeptidase n=1 Tax=Nodosilinea sp. LEGE 07088 TaxID=2777968 RepID=UPI0034D9722B